MHQVIEKMYPSWWPVGWYHRSWRKLGSIAFFLKERSGSGIFARNAACRWEVSVKKSLSGLAGLQIIRLRVVAPGFAAIILAGCGSDNGVAPPTPSELQIVSGNNQTWFAGYALPDPFVVAVKDAAGKGIPNVLVNWSVTGGGTLSADHSTTNADGQASVNYTLGTGTGAQTVLAVVHATSITQTFSTTSAIGWPNMTSIVHFDGSKWSRSLTSNVPGFIKLNAIWGAAANNIFAAGTACGEPIYFHFDGTSWGTPQSCSGGSLFDFQAMWGNSATDIFVAYQNPLPPSMHSGIMHYDGQTWAGSYGIGCSFCDPNLHGVWSRSSSDAFAVGDGGKILHYDGSNWNAETSGTTSSLTGVWGSGSSVFAVGASGTILHNDGTGWTAQSSGTTGSLTAVWGASSTDVFAVGYGGTILHYDGTSWTPQTSGADGTLNAVWGSSGNAVFAVGDQGTILFYNGTNWTAQPAGTLIDLRGVWGTSPTNVFAVGVPLPPK